MGSIWAFCLQTLTVSLVAAMLLLIKRLLADKLSPRWQYGIWGLLALRILIPADISRNVIVGFGMWLETAKAMAEGVLDSAYSAVYTPISVKQPFPVILEAPRSLTDWLFVVYAAGAAACALRYLISYGCLRLRLRRAEAPPAEISEAVARVCTRYGLKQCRVIAVPGLDSAFVCGIFKPTLAVPAGTAVDDKVILHELLHLKHWDILQGIFWAALRCLHWCNPLMHYVFDRIGNDMESLCDQRVLERLEGEERREYGRILLAMANRRYARTPGTSSISNGGKNIARRIDAIVRFKKYPRGMSLVSVCIVFVLLSPVLFGTAAAYGTDVYWPDEPIELLEAFAVARVQRCTTVAGAIDTYAKGLMQENGIYIAIASPLSTHEALAGRMAGWHLDNGEGLEYLDDSRDYAVYDLVRSADGSCTAWLVFAVTDFAEEEYQALPTDGQAAVVIPLRIFREGDSWVVEERAERIISDTWFSQVEYYDDMPFLAQKTLQCETGTITVAYRSEYTVDNTVTTNDIFGWKDFDPSLKPDAQFSYVSWYNHVRYQSDLAEEDLPQNTAALRVWQFDDEEELERIDPENEKLPSLRGESTSGSTSSGYSFTIQQVDAQWDGELYCGDGGGIGGALDMEELPTLPMGYLVQIIFDDTVVEEIVIEGVQP